LVPPLNPAHANECAATAEGAGELAAAALATVAARQTAARRAQAVAVVKGWSPEQRRAAALRLHRDAVTSDCPRYFDRHPVTVLADCGLPLSRADLQWSLHLLVDERGLDDGDAHRLPATAAAALDRDALDGLAPVLEAVLDEVHDSSIPSAIRRDLCQLFGTGLDHATGNESVPAHIFRSDDGFVLRLRTERAGLLADRHAGDVLLHAASLRTATPSATWSRTAGKLAPPAVRIAHAILDHFTTVGGYVHSDTDHVLRGLTWIAATDTAPDATAIICRVAVAAGSAGTARHREPFAPLTAAAAVTILATRASDLAIPALTDLSNLTRSRSLRGRVTAALNNLTQPAHAPPAAG
jgi:hypothetical protein